MKKWGILVLVVIGLWFSYDIVTRKVFLNDPEFVDYYPAFRHWFLSRFLSGTIPVWNPYWGIGHTTDIEATIPLDVYSVLEWAFGPKFYLFQGVQFLFLLLAGFYSLSSLGISVWAAVLGSLCFFFSPWVSYCVFYFTLINIYAGVVLATPHVLLWFETGLRKHLFWLIGIIVFTLFGTRPDFWFLVLTYCALLAICSALFTKAYRRLLPVAGALLLAVAIHSWQIVWLLQILAQSGRVHAHGLHTIFQGEIYEKLWLSVRTSVFLRLLLLGALGYLASGAKRGWRVGLWASVVVVAAALRIWKTVEVVELTRSCFGFGAIFGFLVYYLVRRPSPTSVIRLFCLLIPLSYYWCRVGAGDVGEVGITRFATKALLSLFGYLAIFACSTVERNRRAQIFYALVVSLFLVRDQGQIVLNYLCGMYWIPSRDNFIFDFALMTLAAWGLHEIPRWRSVVLGGTFFWLAVAIAPNKYYGQWEIKPAPDGFGNYDGIRGADAVVNELRTTSEWRFYFTPPGGFEATTLKYRVNESGLYSSLINARYRDWTNYRRFGIRPGDGWSSHPANYLPETIAKLAPTRTLGFPNDLVYWWKLRAWLPRNAAVMELLGIQHIVSDEPVLRIPAFADHRQIGKFHTARVVDPLPRAFVVDNLPESKLAEFSETLDARGRHGGIQAVGMDLTFVPAVITRYEPEDVRVTIDTPKGGIFVLTDLFHPFWSATLDGEPVNLFPAMYLFRGLRVTGGKHQIVFRAQIPFFHFGCMASLLALAVYLWLARGFPLFVVSARPLPRPTRAG